MDQTREGRVAVVIEDDEDVRGLLETTLRHAGFTVHATSSGTAGAMLVRQQQPLVTTVDISLPDIDGFEVTRRVRTFSDTVIIMLTARAEEIDTLMGLEAGADDYVTKPFRPRELRARIEAILRRARPEPAPPSPWPSAPAARPSAPAVTAVPPGDDHPGHVLAHRGLRLDRQVRTAELDGEVMHLTRSEFDLLAALLAAQGRVLSKAELVREMWQEQYGTGTPITEADKRTVEVHLANLRRKLGENAAAPRFIQTVRGLGYRLTSR